MGILARRRWWVFGAGLILTLSLAVAVIALSRDVRGLLSLERPPRLDLVAVALGLVGVNHLLQATLWHFFARDLLGPRDPLPDILRYSLAGLTRNLPAAFYWSTGTRVLLYREDGHAAFAGLATGVELSLQMIAGAAVAVALLAWPWGTAAATLLLALPLLVRSRSFRGQSKAISGLTRRWPALVQSLQSLSRLSQRTLVWSLGLYCVMWLLGGLFLQSLVAAVGAPMPPAARLYGLWVAASLAGMAGSVLLGGLGVLREITLTGLLAPALGLPAATLLSLLTRACLIAGGWLWGLLAAGACRLIAMKRGTP